MVHYLKHVGRKKENHVCSNCDLFFKQRHSLMIYELKYHGSEEEELKIFIFVCSNCNKRFSFKCQLLELEKIHGEKTLNCTQCDMKFISSNRLNMHFKNRHTDTKKPKTEESMSKF